MLINQAAVSIYHVGTGGLNLASALPSSSVQLPLLDRLVDFLPGESVGWMVW